MESTEKLKEEIRKTTKILQQGGIILYPTDTVWGIGCDATNPEAVARIYALKKRKDAKTMLLLLDDIGKLASYVDVPTMAYDLLEVSVDRPMTIIYPHARNLASNLIAEDGTVGIRITKEVFSKGLIGCFKKPVVSTSANISGSPAPACFDDICEEVCAGVDYIVDFRRNEHVAAVPSGIIRLGMNNEIEIIRH